MQIQINRDMVWEDTPLEVINDTTFTFDQSVSQSVGQGRGDKRLTDLVRVGEGLNPAALAIVGGLVGQIVDRPIQSIEPLAQYGRVLAVRIVPQRDIDPVLPLVLRAESYGYWYWYRRYWKSLMRYMNEMGQFGTLRTVQRMTRRLLSTLVRMDMTARERAYFEIWLMHGPLGDYQMI